MARDTHSRARLRLTNACVVLVVLVFSTGCLSRRLTVTSEPPGARVYRDREDLGTTPLTVPFHYGGESEFLLLHEEGEEKYRPTRLIYDTGEFFYDTFPFDVLVELTPVPQEDEHSIHVVLERDTTVATVEGDPKGYVDALLERAAEMRERGRMAVEMGPPPLAPLFPPIEDGDPVIPPRRR